MRRLRTVAILVCFCALSQQLRASTVIFRTDAELAALSERVVHGRVVAQRSTRGPQGRIYTVTTLQIVEDLTGVDGESVEIWELGGQVDNEVLYVGGAVQYQIGQEVLVFLERGPLGLRSVAMGFSKFDVLAEVNGDRRLRRNLRDTVVVGGAAAREPMLSELRALTMKVTGRAPRPGRRPRVGEELTTVWQPFTKLGGEPGWRWIEADSGTPVNWYKNTSADPPLLSGDAVAEIQTALSAWTDPPTATIVLQYAGTTLQSDADGPWSGLGNGSGVITFEDPNNEISGSTLAIGGGSGFIGTGGTVNGTTYNGFTRGYVIFQNAADLSTSFRQSLNFSRVLEHEIGHAIGLGHTQTDGSVPNATSNIMYPSCCSSSTPTPPALGPDDFAGLNHIYPDSGGPSCSYSLNPTSAPAAAGGGSGSVSVSTLTGCSWSASSNAGFLGISSGGSGSGPGTVNYTVAANTSITPRSGTLTVAGETFTVNQAGATCSYTLTPASDSAPAAGGSGSVGLQTPAGCAWMASSNAGFILITSSNSGSGSATINYNVAQNGVNARSGTLTIGGQTFTLNQFGTGPMVFVDKPALRYGATLSGTLVTAQTTSQVVRLTQGSGPAVTWTATSNQPWLTVSPTSGSGSRALTVTATPANVGAPTSVSGAITITLNGAGNTAGPIPVTLTTMITGSSGPPLGVVDTPLDNTTGVVGAIPVTGWSLDDVDVTNVYICRAAVTSESWNPDGRCAGTAAHVFLGEAVFIEGARPDVQFTFPTLPRNYRGGWGFMILTNMLPNQGNGAYTLFVHAFDRDGRTAVIGSRNITCDNAHATKPFGTIDTPAQGGIANGANYVNFGWALTPLPKTIPTDGSTISVFVDGSSIGSPTYNNLRSDIATLFPGYNNSNGAVGFKIINATALEDGLHTIAWTVTDNQGATEGIGSRYFTVANATSGLVAAMEAAPSPAALAAAPTDTTPIVGRRGWDTTAPWRAYGVGASGRAVIRGEEVDRLELWLGEGTGGRYTGYLRVGNDLAKLPVGSQLDPNAGMFTWSPGIGFVGTYDLVFVRWADDRPVAQRNIRVILRPKSGGYVGVQVEIDVPRSDSQVGQPFVLAGWAADLDAAVGTGIDTLHVWAIPSSGGAPIFIGTPDYGGGRPDVAAVHGDRFRESGFALVTAGLPPGTYDLAVFAWSNVSSGFAPAKTVRVTIR